MTPKDTHIERARAFCESFGLQAPVLMAPMAGACPPELALGVANAGGMGACGALLLSPDGIEDWAARLRARTNGAFQMNLWVPDPAPARDATHEETVRDYLSKWGPQVTEDAGDETPVDFAAQCAAILKTRPHVVSSIMGLYPEAFVASLKQNGIKWFATVTTVKEAREAEAAGADAIIAQGMEAGGHRGAFQAEQAGNQLIGLFALVPAIADAVRVPVIATGGIADGRGMTAALLLGASAVQIGTALLRTPEAAIAPAWADAIGAANPEDTAPTRAFSGRLGRSIKTAYVRDANSAQTPEPAPYPVQRGLTKAMRAQAAKDNNIDQMQAWAGQAAYLAKAEPAEDVVRTMWQDAQALLGGRPT